MVAHAAEETGKLLRLCDVAGRHAGVAALAQAEPYERLHERLLSRHHLHRAACGEGVALHTLVAGREPAVLGDDAVVYACALRGGEEIGCHGTHREEVEERGDLG